MTRASFILRGAITAGPSYGATAVGPYREQRAGRQRQQ